MKELSLTEIPLAYRDGREVWGRDIHSKRKIAMYYDKTHERWFTTTEHKFVKPTHFVMED